MEQVVATRSELLARRSRIALARQGRDLLEEKRDQLMEEFRREAEVVLGETGTLDRAAAESRLALAFAEAMDGPAAVSSAALGSIGRIGLETSTSTIMGVRLADIRYEPTGRLPTGRGYTLAGSSAALDAAAERFETEVELVLGLAGHELRLRRLAEEIGKATRRVNALETVVIPQLDRELRAIQRALDERERQDRFRLKRIKTRRGTRVEAAN